MTIDADASSVAIAMTTAPRRVPTLQRSLSSLREAGFHEVVHVFAEPEMLRQEIHSPGSTGDDLVLHLNTSRHGCYRNWRQALQHLLACTAAPWLLVVQDDATWLPGSADLLRDETRSRQRIRTGFLSPYVVEKDVPAEALTGWNECRAGWLFWGALALCLPRETAEDLLRHPRFLKHPGPQQVDAIVAASMLDLGRPSFVHVPSLVDHIGETSTLGHDDISAKLRGYRFGEK